MATASKSFAERIKEARTKAEMTEWVQKVYAETERWIQPMPPFILIRTLPRSTVSSGGILLPEKQNKPNIEAIVLAVYDPYWEKVESRTRDGKVEDISVYNECDIKVGDHIVLPHFVGLPDTFLDEREYRLIKEDDAISVLHYREKGELRKMVKDAIIKSLSKPFIPTAEGSKPATIVEGAVEELFTHFDVIPKRVLSKTLSGA